MRKTTSSTYTPLYIIWGLLYVLTAVLGFFFPSVHGGGKAFLVVLSVCFFIPPWMILSRANKTHDAKHRTIIRALSFASLAATLLLLILNLRSVGYSEAVGVGLQAALNIVSAPMVASNLYALPLFLWATLLIGSISKPK